VNEVTMSLSSVETLKHYSWRSRSRFGGPPRAKDEGTLYPTPLPSPPQEGRLLE
jgi:hypothetical protein